MFEKSQFMNKNPKHVIILETILIYKLLLEHTGFAIYKIAFMPMPIYYMQQNGSANLWPSKLDKSCLIAYIGPNWE